MTMVMFIVYWHFIGYRMNGSGELAQIQLLYCYIHLLHLYIFNNYNHGIYTLKIDYQPPIGLLLRI